MADETNNKYSWQTDFTELYKDLKDVSNSNRTEGASIYNFHTLRNLRDGKNTN